MAKTYRSAVIPASAEAVWLVVRDFNGLPSWHAGIGASEVENDVPAAEVGCVRRITVAGGGGIVREQLVALDDLGRSYSYEILEGPFPVRYYHSTIRVVPITDTGQAFVEWYSYYDADSADEQQLDKTLGEGVYATGLKGLQSYFGS